MFYAPFLCCFAEYLIETVVSEDELRNRLRIFKHNAT